MELRWSDVVGADVVFFVSLGTALKNFHILMMY